MLKMERRKRECGEQRGWRRNGGIGGLRRKKRRGGGEISLSSHNQFSQSICSYSPSSGSVHQLSVFLGIDKLMPEMQIFFFFLRISHLSLFPWPPIACMSATLFNHTATIGGWVCFQYSGMQPLAENGNIDFL